MMNTRVISVRSKVPTVPDRSTGVGTPSARERRRTTHEPHPSKHRQCGAQQVNERLYELDPKLRDRQRAHRGRVPPLDREGRGPARVAQAGHDPVRRARGRQDRRGEHLRRADREPDRGAQPGLPRHQPRPQQRPRPVVEPRRRPEHRVRAGDQGPEGQADQRHHPRADDARLLRHRRLGEDEGRRRHPAVADRPLPQLLGLQPRRRPARLRAVPRRPGAGPTAW